MNSSLGVAVLGASGYSGQELLRLLLQHPRVELKVLGSRSLSGQSVAEAIPRLGGIGVAESLCFEDPELASLPARGVELVFLALPHGVSLEYGAKLVELGLRVIDLSADYRLFDADLYAQYYGQEHPQPELMQSAVYGLVERARSQIAGAQLVAAPGCYPTSILLPLLPLLEAGLIEAQGIVANSLSGASGAGRSAKVDLLFCEISESLRAYGLPSHRHLAEIEEQLSLQAGEEVVISFQPHLVPARRGLLSTINAVASEKLQRVEQLSECFEAAYGQEALIRLRGAGGYADTADVVGTAFLDLGWHWDARTRRVILSAAEDNLSKGAATQAIQCMEVQEGWEAEGFLARV